MGCIVRAAKERQLDDDAAFAGPAQPNQAYTNFVNLLDLAALAVPSAFDAICPGASIR